MRLYFSTSGGHHRQWFKAQQIISDHALRPHLVHEVALTDDLDLEGSEGEEAVGGASSGGRSKAHANHIMCGCRI